MATAIVTAYGFCIAAVQPEAIGPLDHDVGDALSGAGIVRAPSHSPLW